MRVHLRLLAAAALLGFGAAALSANDAPPIFLTGCVPVDDRTVDLFLMNPGPGAVQLNGPVRIIFAQNFTSTRPSLTLQIKRFIPPGANVHLGRIAVNGPLLTGESCQIEARDAVR